MIIETQRRLEELNANLQKHTRLNNEHARKKEFVNVIFGIQPQGSLEGEPYSETDNRKLSYQDGVRYGHLNAVSAHMHQECKLAKQIMLIIACVLGLALFIVWCILDPLMGWNFLFDEGENLATVFQDSWFLTLFVMLLLSIPFIGANLLIYFLFIRKPLSSLVYAKHEEAYNEARLSDLKEYDREFDIANGYHNHDLPLLEKQILELREQIDKDDILASNFKNIAIVTRLVGYFQQGRVESVKEAVNLMISEDSEQARHYALLQAQRAQNEQMAHLNAQLNETNSRLHEANSRLSDLEHEVSNIDRTAHIDVDVRVK